MSYVIAVASKEFVIIKSDGRVTADSGTITNERYDKTFSLSVTVIGGYIGSSYLGLKTLRILRRHEDFLHDPEIAIRAIRDILFEILPEAHGKNVAFVVGGMGSDGSPVLCEYSTQWGDGIVTNRESANGFGLLPLCDDQHISNCRSALLRFMNDGYNIPDAMEHVIKEAAKTDVRINDIIFTRSIRF